MPLLLPTSFSPLHSFLGGLILSSSVSALLAQTGTVLGISGFFHAAVRTCLITVPRQLRHQLTSTASAHADDGRSANASAQARSDRTASSTARFFTLGLLSAGVVLAAGRTAFEGKLGLQLFDDAVPVVAIPGTSTAVASPVATLLLGILLPGLLVGAGTKLGSGCTSGHFLCGLSRLSPRSFAATATFFSVAVLTNVLRPLGDLLPYPTATQPAGRVPTNPDPLLLLAFQIPAFVYGVVVPYIIAGPTPKEAADHGDEARAERQHRHEQGARITSFSTGLHFGLGLALAGMLRPSKVLGFLNLSPAHIAAGEWDPSLAMVALGGILPASLTYFTYLLPRIQAQRSARSRKPTSAASQYGAISAERSATGSKTPYDPTAPLLSAAAPLWRVPISAWTSWAATRIDARLITGAALFGVGWGLSGLCPGPVLVALGANSVPPPTSPDSLLTSTSSSLLGGGAAPTWDRIAARLSTQPGTAGSLLATALFTAAMAVGGLVV